MARMSAIIVGWNPAHRDRWNYAAIVQHVGVAGLHLEPWSVDLAVPAGTEAWLVLLGDHGPGLLGHGVVLSGGTPPAPAVIQVAFDALLPLGDHLPARTVEEALPDIGWEDGPTAGIGLQPHQEAALREVWMRLGPPPGPEPAHLVPGTYPESAVARVAVNRFEHDPEARRACIAHRGTSCAACGFSFEQAYGDAGADFIQVHHVVPADRLAGGYALDPLTDLVPLCANCHAMAHRAAGSPRSVAELRQLLGNAGYLQGTTVSPEELEAQRAAREILG